MNWRGVVFSTAFALLIPVAATAQPCLPNPPALAGNDINADTKASLNAIQELLAKLAVGLDFKKTLRNVFIEHPETMQWYVVLVWYHDGCVIIQDDKTLSTSQRLDLLQKLRDSTISELPSLRPAAVTSPPLPSPTPNQPIAHHGFNFYRRELSTDITPVASQTPTATQTLNWAEKYLRPAPIVVTTGNQYWVNVGYAGTRTEGERELSVLKESHPEYDFALYMPFGRNDKWNIVIASWVSEEEANTALDAARKINPTSFIWRACSSISGGQCVLNRKLCLALTLKEAGQQAAQTFPACKIPAG